MHFIQQGLIFKSHYQNQKPNQWPNLKESINLTPRQPIMTDLYQKLNLNQKYKDNQKYKYNQESC